MGMAYHHHTGKLQIIYVAVYREILEVFVYEFAGLLDVRYLPTFMPDNHCRSIIYHRILYERKNSKNVRDI